MNEMYKKYEHNLYQKKLSKEEIVNGFNNLTYYEQECLLKKLAKSNHYDIFYNYFKKDLDLVTFFIKKWIECDKQEFIKSDKYNYFLKYAIISYRENNNFEALKKLLDVYINDTNFDVNNRIEPILLLHLMAKQNDVPFVKYLIKNGAKTNLVDAYQDSFACSSIGHDELLRYAISLPNFDPLKGHNILSLAMFNELDSAVDIILDSDLMLNQRFISMAKIYDEDKVNELMSIYEKRKIEKQLEEVNTPAKKLKL